MVERKKRPYKTGDLLREVQYEGSALLHVHIQCTVEPAHVVTSFKQSPVLKGHNFLVLS
jgi:hypothetical protein